MRPCTKINGRDVPIEAGEPSVVWFARGRLGAREAGPWEFWTAFGPGMEWEPARCRPRADPGAGFRATAEHAKEERVWKVAAEAAGLRPSTRSEVLSWLRSHREQGDVAERCWIDGRTMNVEYGADGVTLREPLDRRGG